ncbi:MAG: class I SAM-dependent methyltransferase [Roseiflexaceae bacterium]|nr:class I SAM-dependent methyltransferase [Roseiflexaceae bacterium]
MQSLYEDMQQRYREGALPWDVELPPPEVLDLAAALPPGRALDLGCGPGRACLHLAQLGWQCDGVDFVAEAVRMAEQRAEAADLAERARFHQASVTALDFLNQPYDLVIDVGCMHNLRGADLRAYVQGVARLTLPQATMLMFARLADFEHEPRGLPDATIRATLASSFNFSRAEYGQSRFNGVAVPSAWYWLTRTAD